MACMEKNVQALYYVHNIPVAQELSEDVFVELLIHKRRYNFKTSLKTHIFTIARNTAVDYIRRCSRNHECTYEYIESESDRLNLEDEFIKKERERELHWAIDKLNEDYKAILHLIYFEDMSYTQAGKVMKKAKEHSTYPAVSETIILKTLARNYFSVQAFYFFRLF